MDYTVFLTTFSVIFLAELGDKTQLTAMALAVRFPWFKSFLGIAAAFAVLNIAAVAIGKTLFAYLPLFWIKIVSAVLFVFFGVSTLRNHGTDNDEDDDVTSKTTGAVLTSFLMILMAELGDKTQLVTAALAAQHNAPLAVFTGSTLALWTVSLLGIFAGRQLIKFIPLSFIHRASGALFLIFGAVIAFQALSAR